MNELGKCFLNSPNDGSFFVRFRRTYVLKTTTPHLFALHSVSKASVSDSSALSMVSGSGVSTVSTSSSRTKPSSSNEAFKLRYYR